MLQWPSETKQPDRTIDRTDSLTEVLQNRPPTRTGKTESQKYVLRYLCLSGSQSGRLEKLILDGKWRQQVFLFITTGVLARITDLYRVRPPLLPFVANPLLEAFGNAKTIRNNNSSRFGKFIEIHYSNKFTVTGGLFFHYLLEKSRICTQSAGERNYHIFYQLCACLPADQWRALELGSPDDFRYLNGGCTQYFCSREIDSQLGAERKSELHNRQGAIQDQLIDDVKCYQQTDRALTNFGVGSEQKRSIYSIVAAVLHLGNISFCDDPDDNRGGCRLEPGKSERALEITARLMGLDKELLLQSLISRIMSTTRGGHKGTVYMVQLSAQQAQAARDALAKAIYSKLFDHIVTKIVNKSIPFSSSYYYIGVLDVAGFEYFQHNSFEQFLINFCNEKLQQFFNERILKEEQSIYEKEGLDLKRVEFIDNQDCIQLLENKSSGIFDLLDEESRLPKPSAQHFTQSVHAANKGHFRLALPRTSKLKAHREIRDDEGFLIRHFAGAVCYETHSFIDKNNDALHASLKNLMLEASHEMLRDLFADASHQSAPNSSSHHSPPGSHGNQQQTASFSSGLLSGQPASSNKLNFISVGTTFRSQLNDLMAKLRSTGSHFIRCIKPNSEMVAHKFEGAQILSQLHCSGMDSVLELMQQGYPSRSSFNDLYQSYKRFLPADLARLDSHLFCRALFKAIGLSDHDFRFGSSKVFFRPGKFAEFDQIIKSDSEHVAELVRRVSRWLVRSRWRKAQYCSLSVIKLNKKILYRRNLIIRLQRHWRAAIVSTKLRFRLKAIKSARAVEVSLNEFEQIAAQQLKNSPDKALLDEQSQLLRREVGSFLERIGRDIKEIVCGSKAHPEPSMAEAKAQCQAELEKLVTKRDLLVRSIKDKIAKQKELVELERQVSAENERRQDEAMAKRREEEIKQQRGELELRRQQEMERLKREVNNNGLDRSNNNNQARTKKPLLVDSGTDPISGQFADQELRDYGIALKLAQDTPMAQNQVIHSSGETSPTGQQVSGRSSRLSGSSAGPHILAPSQNAADLDPTGSKFDLTKWKYSDLRDTINTSCDLELLEACKREFHRRLKVYHAWRAMNSRSQQQGNEELRAPSSVMGLTSAGSSLSDQDTLKAHNQEQRYFRIPFVKSSSSSGQRGWWFAHFDGQWIARQLELHPDKEPILLIAGLHDIEMCELSLRETRLTSKRGAEILPQEFEEEWLKHGGKAYNRKGAQSATTTQQIQSGR